MLKTAWQGDTTAGLELRSEARRCLSFVSTSAIWNKISYLAICSHALDPPAQRLACAVVGSVPQEVSIRLSRPHKSRTKPAKPCRLDASDLQTIDLAKAAWQLARGRLLYGGTNMFGHILRSSMVESKKVLLGSPRHRECRVLKMRQRPRCVL